MKKNEPSLDILTIAILEMCGRKKGIYFCPKDVVKWLFPQSWEYFVADLYQEMMQLYQQDKIEVTANGEAAPTDALPEGELRIRLKVKLQ